jgi:hypothetical protein
MSSTAPVLIDGAPEPMLLARDADRNLIKVPFVSGYGKTPADLLGEALAELQRPLPDRLVADRDASGGEHLLDHAQAERKPKVQPDGIAYHLSRKAVAGIARMTGVLHPSHMPRSSHPPVNLTVPALHRPAKSPSAISAPNLSASRREHDHAAKRLGVFCHDVEVRLQRKRLECILADTQVCLGKVRHWAAAKM